MNPVIQEVDKVEIITLQDNYVDVLVMDSDEVIKRPMPLKDVTPAQGTISVSPLAEHGFSSFISVSAGGRTRSLLFDFGCSENGAAYNADLLGLDLSRVEVLALSHGHMDHLGGLTELLKRTGKQGLDLVLHPGVFKQERYIKTPDGFKLVFPALERRELKDLGLSLVETKEPLPLLEGSLIFLGEIPRVCPFETGMPGAFYIKDGREETDIIDDDSSLVFNLKGKGLVVLSGCAHAGIINTVRHAKKTTGIEKVHVVMGGFHLTGPAFADKIQPTIDALVEMSPRYVIPAHCTGRDAAMAIEKRMPDEFVLNMSGTGLVFE